MARAEGLEVASQLLLRCPALSAAINCLVNRRPLRQHLLPPPATGGARRRCPTSSRRSHNPKTQVKISSAARKSPCPKGHGDFFGASVHNRFDKNMMLLAQTHMFQSAHLYFKSFLRTIPQRLLCQPKLSQ